MNVGRENAPGGRHEPAGGVVVPLFGNRAALAPSRLPGRLEDWIDRKELARRVGVHPKTIYRRQSDERMPLPFAKSEYGRCGPVRYHWPTIQAWYVARCEAGDPPW